MTQPVKRSNGLPLAAHLALLVIASIAAAFAITFAVVLMLPPRPPDLMRSDQLITSFIEGYRQAAANQKIAPERALTWRIEDQPPNDRHDAPPLRRLSRTVARSLDLPPDSVRVHARPHRANVMIRVEEHRFRSEHRGSRDDERSDRARMEIERWDDRPPPPPNTPMPLEPDDAPRFALPPNGVILVSGFEVAAQLPDGRWAIMRQSRTQEDMAWISRAALAIGATLLIVMGLSLYVARRLAKPITRFADAAEHIGADLDGAAAPVEGPREVRRAARAVNAMQERLRSLVADRTETLAAVAHDMRTPLMRINLVLETAPDAVREKLRKEIREVEALVASFIAFAREDPTQEPRVRLDLTALVQSAVDDLAETGMDVLFEDGERVVMTGQPLGLKRMIGNLVDNAVKHGGKAKVTLSRTSDGVAIDVDDDGPGVPPEKREDVFKPFVRLNENATRGAGLGLPSARSIARAHGGDVQIVDRDGGGARVRVTLPLSA